MPGYQLFNFGRPVAPVRDTEDDVIADARRLKLAAFDRDRREWYVPIPAEIMRSRASSAFRGRGS